MLVRKPALPRVYSLLWKLKVGSLGFVPSILHLREVTSCCCQPLRSAVPVGSAVYSNSIACLCIFTEARRMLRYFEMVTKVPDDNRRRLMAAFFTHRKMTIVRAKILL